MLYSICQSRVSSFTVAIRVLPMSPLASVMKQRYSAPLLADVISTRRALEVAFRLDDKGNGITNLFGTIWGVESSDTTPHDWIKFYCKTNGGGTGKVHTMSASLLTSSLHLWCNSPQESESCHAFRNRFLIPASYVRNTFLSFCFQNFHQTFPRISNQCSHWHGE